MTDQRLSQIAGISTPTILRIRYEYRTGFDLFDRLAQNYYTTIFGKIPSQKTGEALTNSSLANRMNQGYDVKHQHLDDLLQGLIKGRMEFDI